MLVKTYLSAKMEYQAIFSSQKLSIESCPRCGFVSTFRDKLEDHVEKCRGRPNKKKYLQEVVRVVGSEPSKKRDNGEDVEVVKTRVTPTGQKIVETRSKSHDEVIEVCDIEGCKSHLGCLPQWEKDYIYSQGPNSIGGKLASVLV